MALPQPRIERRLSAFFVSGMVSTTIVGAGAGAANLLRAMLDPRWPHFDLAGFVEQGLIVWMVITMAGLVTAGPFVAAATWAGARFRIEGLAYYAALGGLSAALLVLATFGPPRRSDFGSVMAAWTFLPPCAILWGAAWWLLHRRWKAVR